MHGVITTRHLVTKAPTIIMEFGLPVYMRCVFAVLSRRKKTTFLECVSQKQQNFISF